MRPENLPPEVVDQTLARVDAVRRALPAETRQSLPDDDEARRALADELIAEGAGDVIARLRGGEDA